MTAKQMTMKQMMREAQMTSNDNDTTVRGFLYYFWKHITLFFSLQIMEKKNKFSSYLKKLGIAGFLFFLIKGLIWIGIFFFVKSKM